MQLDAASADVQQVVLTTSRFMNALSRCINSDWLTVSVQKKSNVSSRSTTVHSLPFLSLQNVLIVIRLLVWNAAVNFSWMSLCFAASSQRFSSNLLRQEHSVTQTRLRSRRHRRRRTRHLTGVASCDTRFSHKQAQHARACLYTHTHMQAHNSVVSVLLSCDCMQARGILAAGLAEAALLQSGPFVVHEQSNQLCQKIIY